MKIYEKPDRIKIAVVAVGGEGVRIGAKNNPKLLLKLAGQPFLAYVLNMLLGQFECIYLLTGSYGEQISTFVRLVYPDQIEHSIHLVNGGKEGNAKAISRLSGCINEPFLYMDGNVICSPSIVRTLVSSPLSAITLLVSPVSLVNTHLHVELKENKIVKMFPLVHDEWQKSGLFCSLGVMTINPALFNLSPNMKSFNDLDLVIDFIFKNRADLEIRPVVYSDWWCCIHTMRDLRLAKKYGMQLFSELSKTVELTG